MLPKFHSDCDLAACAVQIHKRVQGEDASNLGAFSFGTVIELSVHVPRALGSRAVVLRLIPDDLPCELPKGETPLRNEEDAPYTDYPLTFAGTEAAVDEYTLTLDTATLCGDRQWGLYYYEFLFLRGADTLFTDSINNVDFTLSRESASRFRLLIWEPTFDTPHWFRGGVMYHIFVDRFCRGAGPVTLRRGSELDEDWDGGNVQYNAYPGAPLANNRFFGGNLWGIIEKLDILQERGITTLYLSPIFDAASNHKYDTGDYETVDPFFGGEAALKALLAATRKRGMHVILDGVFNHTGDDSRYFNRYGHYNDLGAYQSPMSKYADWYSFYNYPDEYECWWNIPILPRLDGRKASVRDYFTAEGGIAPARVRQGVSGWRLDVADELTGDFLDQLRENTHKAGISRGEQPLLIGEVWENAADKVAYGKRRRYFGGRQLDSVMNYPLRQGIIALARDGDASLLYNTLTELYSSYPTPVCHCLMNLLGTHDTERIITVLGDPDVGDDRTNEQLSVARLTEAQYALARARLKLAATVLYTVFGVPSVFYGDEAGLQGHHDPFCRLPYPWGREDAELLAHFTHLGQLRAEHSVFADGNFRILFHTDTALLYERSNQRERILVAVNGAATALHLPAEYTTPYTLLFPSRRPAAPTEELTVPAGEAVILLRGGTL
ncbi:MAG: glycoside hydrolase family 13 protein [Clostridia bacterium]|nr:glycoside hydrolase family 13 protein [Clostridia bacterium]